MRLIYKCSNGKEFELENLLGLRITSDPFHSHSWSPSTVSQKYGAKVTGFSKEAVTYSATFKVDMPYKETADLLDSLAKCFDIDISKQTPGKIYFGEQYISCYGIELKITPDGFAQSVEASFYCPYPFWIFERKYEWLPSSSDDEFLDFPFDFPFDFHTENGSGYAINDGVTDCNFKLVIYGPVQNPSVLINGINVGGYVTLESNDILVIDTKDYSVTKIAGSGAKTDCFRHRFKDQDIFSKLPSGGYSVSWEKSFGVGLTLYQERSIPTWSV